MPMPGKLIFVAPTKPLVHQQVQACHSVSSIPESDIIVMTGITMAPAKRAEIWDKKRLIFATPQVVENDIKTGKCPVDKVVLVVVDEAHRATGNTAMVNTIKAVRFSARH
jgi:ERCC4-related helicase